MVLNSSSLTRASDTDPLCCLRVRITLQCQGGSSSRWNDSERAVQSVNAVQTKWANGNEGCEQFLTESSDMGTDVIRASNSARASSPLQAPVACALG